MKPKSIGIVGGAGPLAGSFLLERLLILSNKKYGCYRDADFPKVFLISFPFSEMLSSKRNAAKLCKELYSCLRQLRQNGASILAIACNTLHAFLKEEENKSDLIHLPQTTAQEISMIEKPLVFCTTTSAEVGLHQRYFPCIYPNKETQKEVDVLIDQILRGQEERIILKKLEDLLKDQDAKTIILGCTELSLFSEKIRIPNKQIIDPLEVMANKILEKSFQKEGL